MPREMRHQAVAKPPLSFDVLVVIAGQHDQGKQGEVSTRPDCPLCISHEAETKSSMRCDSH